VVPGREVSADVAVLASYGLDVVAAAEAVIDDLA
jgi:hypothetical protein